MSDQSLGAIGGFEVERSKGETIVAAAIELFGAQGFDNTSTQAISTAAGIGTGTLFKYYKSKDDLILDAYIATKIEMMAVVKKGVDPAWDFETLLQHVWFQTIDWALANPAKNRFVQQVKSSRFAEHKMPEDVTNGFLFFFVALKGAQEAGKVAKLPFALIEMTFTSLFSAAVDFAVASSGKDVESIKKTTFNMLLNAIKPMRRETEKS